MTAHATIIYKGRWSYWISVRFGDQWLEPDGVPWVRSTLHRAIRLAEKELRRIGEDPRHWSLVDGRRA